MDTIADKVLGAINSTQGQRANTESLRGFEQSAKAFQDLIDRGMVTSRGYNLLTIDTVPSYTRVSNMGNILMNSL